jgi:hypothetical protein
VVDVVEHDSLHIFKVAPGLYEHGKFIDVVDAAAIYVLDEIVDQVLDVDEYLVLDLGQQLCQVASESGP